MKKNEKGRQRETRKRDRQNGQSERQTESESESETDRQGRKHYLIMTPITLIGQCYNKTNFINIHDVNTYARME